MDNKHINNFNVFIIILLSMIKKYYEKSKIQVMQLPSEQGA